MYRSRSTSSVYSGAPYEFKPETLSSAYEPEVTSRRPEAETPTVAWSTNSAAKLPTNAARRPLPKALLPKAARGGAVAPTSIGGIVFSKQKPGSPSHAHASAAAKTPSVHGSALGDSGYGSLSSGLSRVGVSAPVVYSPSPPLFGGRERASAASVTDGFSAGKAFRFHSMEEAPFAWYPPGNLRPLRRKDPVVEDSIYPILKEALAKDREPEEDRRRTKEEDKRTEEEVVRDAFRRPNSFLSPSPSSPVLTSRNIYSSSSSVDDVFASSEATMTSSAVGNHSKSSSEIVVSNRVPSKHNEADAQVGRPSHLSNSLHTLTVEGDEETSGLFRSSGSDKILADSASRTIEIKNRRNLDLGLGLDLDLDLHDEYPVHLTTTENSGLSPLPLPPPPLGFRDADFSTGSTSPSTTVTSPPPFRGPDDGCLATTPPGERSFNQPPIAENNSGKISRSVRRDGERKSQSDESQSSGTREEEEEEMDEGHGLELVLVDVFKGPVGVGFCIEGGRGSLSGDRPITVKRVFKGGFGDASVALFPGDELVSVGGQSMDAYSHFDAWKFIKALPNGNVQMTIKRRNPSHETLPSPRILSPPVGFKTLAR